MSTGPRNRRFGGHARRTAVAGALIASLSLSACAAAPGATAGSDPGLEPADSSSSSSSSAVPRGAVSGFQDPLAAAGVDPASDATAVRIDIPVIGVDAPLELLSLDADGALEPPGEWQSAGWYRDGVVPGAVGPAVIAGHVDSNAGPAVFFRLDELAAGDEIRVRLSDGSVETFAVDRITTAPKDGFPTDAVYGPTPDAQLRLITCDGEFDSATGHYVDNLIVFATRTTPAAG
ncbi:class F sortase [Planctomonas psychrotolerans]|uniref:class F sortase n=1 Tax=Planctomonas psychrotolerans TaxID=2528712 RepID=UPI001239F253|nr:class F sortase [Planctomonas psychrotolerans]